MCVRNRHGAWVKAHIWTHGELSWLPDLNSDASKEERIARTAIIPAEVLREATRSAQS